MQPQLNAANDGGDRCEDAQPSKSRVLGTGASQRVLKSPENDLAILFFKFEFPFISVGSKIF